MIARTVSHYEINARLGESGMDVAYKACDIHFDRFNDLT